MFETENPKIAELASEAKELENDGAKFMDPGAKRKGRGRPKGSTKKEAPQSEAPQPEQLPPPIPTTQMIRPFIEMLSSAMGRGFENKKAEMTPQEMDAITASTAMLADKWLPVMAGQYAAEFMFFTSVLVYGGRLYVIRSENIEAKRARDRANPYVNGSAGPGRPTKDPRADSGFEPSPIDKLPNVHSFTPPAN